MAIATPTAKAPDDAQRSWLKKLGAALDVPVADAAFKATSAAPVATAPDLKSTGAAPPAAPDAKQQDAKKVSPGAQSAAPSKDSPAAPTPKISVAGKPLLIKGAKGKDVKDLQTLLNKHGATLKDDSDFGKLTDEAVREFQKKNPPLVVDGKVGEKTWAALDKDPPAPPTPPDTKPRRVVVIVTDAANNNAVDKADVTIENQSEKTRNTGQATLSLAPGKHNFGVTAPGFKQAIGTVDVTDKEETQLRVELQKAAPQSITIKPLNPPPLAPKGTQQFTATDDTGADVTGQVVWSSSDDNIVLIDARGLATAKDVSGTATITAAITPPVGGASKALVAAPAPTAASTSVKVAGPARDKVLAKITISPSGSRMMSHVKQKFTATGFFVDRSEGNLVADSLVVEWESSKPKFLAIDKKTGVAVANIATTVEITAKDPATGVVSDPVKVTVVDLESIEIVPKKPPSLPERLQIDFSAVAKFSDGTTDPFAVEWESSAEHIVSIDDQTGRATGKSLGTATIKANAGKVNRSIRAEVTITVTQGTPALGKEFDLTGLRRDLQTAEPILKKAFDAEGDMFAAAALEKVDLEDPKSAVANRPPSTLSDQDKTNLHATFAQVDQARLQMVHILHELQATTRELTTATKLQLSLKRPPDKPELTQEQKARLLSFERKFLATVLDAVSQVVPVFFEKESVLAKLGLAIIGTGAVNKIVEGEEDTLEGHREKIKALGDKLDSTITALEDAANDQMRDLKERWRVGADDFAQQTKLYRSALLEYRKLVLRATAKGGGGPGFAKTFASILLASQLSQSARGVLNTALLRPGAAEVRLAELQNRGKPIGPPLRKPDVAVFDNGREIISFLGETKESVEDLEEQVQKVTELYKSSARIDRIFKTWQDALEE